MACQKCVRVVMATIHKRGNQCGENRGAHMSLDTSQRQNRYVDGERAEVFQGNDPKLYVEARIVGKVDEVGDVQQVCCEVFEMLYRGMPRYQDGFGPAPVVQAAEKKKLRQCTHEEYGEVETQAAAESRAGETLSHCCIVLGIAKPEGRITGTVSGDDEKDWWHPMAAPDDADEWKLVEVAVLWAAAKA